MYKSSRHVLKSKAILLVTNKYLYLAAYFIIIVNGEVCSPQCTVGGKEMSVMDYTHSYVTCSVILCTYLDLLDHAITFSRQEYLRPVKLPVLQKVANIRDH